MDGYMENSWKHCCCTSKSQWAVEWAEVGAFGVCFGGGGNHTCDGCRGEGTEDQGGRQGSGKWVLSLGLLDLE